jgi:hypothetical protein
LLQIRKIAHNATRKAPKAGFSVVLPGVLDGSYQRYKTDTNTFLRWLSRAAILCKYKKSKRTSSALPSASSTKPPPSNAPEKTLTLAEKLRAQAGKKETREEEEKKNPVAASAGLEPVVRPIVRHTIRTDLLLRQAELVAKNEKIKVPDVVIQVVRRAIEARKRSASLFTQTGIDNGHPDDRNPYNRHAHFIETLEKAMHILKPGFDTSDSKEPSDMATDKQPAPSKPKPNSKVHDRSGLSNRFSNLDVKDTEDIVKTETTLIMTTIQGTGEDCHKSCPAEEN